MGKLALLLALLASAPASATLITIDPDNVASGTDVTNYFDGVTLRPVEYQGAGIFRIGRTFAADVSDPAYGLGSRALRGNVASFSNAGPSNCWILLTGCGLPSAALVITFTQPTDFVSLVGLWGLDGGFLHVFDENGVSIGSCQDIWGFWDNPCYSHIAGERYGLSTWNMSVTSSTANIRYAVASGQANPVNFDALRYNAVHVPEPSPGALFGAGALALIWIRRRSRQTTSSPLHRR